MSRKRKEERVKRFSTNISSRTIEELLITNKYDEGIILWIGNEFSRSYMGFTVRDYKDILKW